MLWKTKDFSPRFLRRYANLGEIIDLAVKQYIVDVRSSEFPNEDEKY
jgi:3-methyl-2-oxobutanoate hydroxymethyltransferase